MWGRFSSLPLEFLFCILSPFSKGIEALRKLRQSSLDVARLSCAWQVGACNLLLSVDMIAIHLKIWKGVCY